MLALGFVLVVISTVFLVAALAGGSDDPAGFDLGIFDVETDTRGVFLLGAATVLLFVMGLELIRSGVRRTNRVRKDKKQLNRLTQERETHDPDRSQQSAGPESQS